MSKRKAKKTAKPAARTAPSFAERIQAEREQIFKAMGIVSACRLAYESALDTEGCEPDMVAALEAAHDLLNDAASELRQIADHKKRAAPS